MNNTRMMAGDARMSAPANTENTRNTDKGNATGQLSEHFSLEEMTRSGMAIRLRLENKPTASDIARMRELCEQVLEPLRRRYGRICVTSGYRSLAVNKAVGGAARSQHLTGEAADIYVSGRVMAQKYSDFLMAHTDFDQLIVEPRHGRPRWLHISFTRRRKNRHEVINYRACMQ